MAQIVTIHSARRGTGKSVLAANLAVLLAADGARVGVLDAGLQEPGLPGLLGARPVRPTHPLDDYFWGRTRAAQSAQDLTPYLRVRLSGRLYGFTLQWGWPIAGRIFVLPTKDAGGENRHLVRAGLEWEQLTERLRGIGAELRLDWLLIDTAAGLSPDICQVFALADAVLQVLRLDQQAYRATGVLIEVSRTLDVARQFLVVNDLPAAYDRGAVRQQLEAVYACAVAAVVPYTAALPGLAAPGRFVLSYPDQPFTHALRQLRSRLRE